MKAILLTLVFLLSSSVLCGQETPTWDRVYTLDDSFIEMDTAKLTFGGKDIARARFRWTFDQPEALSGEPQLRFKTRLETIEFNCSLHRFRLNEITLLDSAGKIVRRDEMDPPGEWGNVSLGTMMERLYSPACELMRQRTNPPVVARDESDLEKVVQYALSFSQSLERLKDFKPVISRFFAADYLDGYLRDQNAKWFLNLNRETAAKASRAELERFYVSSLNSGYLCSIYLISQYPYAGDGAIPEEKLIPPDILEFIDNHPYTAKYKGQQSNYDYLAENIDSVERLRSYTDLLEGIADLMRKRVVTVGAERSNEYQKVFEDSDLYEPKARICDTDCLGLPKGTRIFDVNVPVLHLQIAQIKGELKVISVTDSSH